MTTIQFSSPSVFATRCLVLVALAVGAFVQPAYAQWSTTGNDIYNDNSGNVGVGTSSAPERFSLIGNLGMSETGNVCCRLKLSTSGSGTVFNHNDNSPIYFQTQATTWMTIKDNGNVGIGVTNPSSKLEVNGNITASGDITVSGNIAAKYQDLAEWVPARHLMEPGTVVTLDPDLSNSVLPSAGPYDTRVAGVVSAQPGIILGEAGEGKVKVATTGRVKVRVDATANPIRIGDLLVTSGREGTAMRSEAVNLGGIEIHRPGTLIGKALEPLDSGEGEILVLLSLQ